MRARFYSDTALENFVDEAFLLHEVEVESNQFNREVQFSAGEFTEELTALVQINGGDVVRSVSGNGGAVG